MINQKYKERLNNKNVIRNLAEFAQKRGKEIGYENVFDYSLGNPSVPVADDFTKTVINMYETKDSAYLHGYSPILGITDVREKIAASLNKRFGMEYSFTHIFPTTGAAGAIAHAVRAVTTPGDTVITFAPYFPEYNPYVEDTGAHLKVVPPETKDFQINFEKFEEMLDETVAAVLVNTPNNPSGAMYSEETLKTLADILLAAEKNMLTRFS